GIVVADASGVWVALNQSLYDSFGAGVLESSTGIVCQNRGAAFSLENGRVNLVASGRRPPHTLMPVLATANSKPVLATATMGGPAHPQIHAELLTSLHDVGRHPPETVEAPR